MPGPTTEVLSDDLEEIRGDLHRLEVVPTTEIHQVNAALSAESSRLSAENHKSSAAPSADLSRARAELTEGLHKSSAALSAEIARAQAGLTTEIYKVDNTVAKQGAEFAVFKWLLGLTLGIALSGIGTGIWWAATLTSRVGLLDVKSDLADVRFGQIEAHLSNIEVSLTQIEHRLNNLDVRLDRIEAALARIVARPDGGAAPAAPR